MPTPNYTEDDFQNGIPANAPIVPIENTSAVYNPKRKLTSDELIQQFYSVKEKAPEIDQAKVDRLRRMGRINQLAQGTKVLADIAGTAMGANVRKRQPDQTAPALFQSYQNMLDKYKDQADAYNLRDFSAKRQNAQFGIQRADKETAQEFANRRQAAIEKNNEAKNALENSKFLMGLKQKQQKIDNDKAYQQARLSKIKGGGDKKVTIRTKNKAYNLDQSQVDLYSSEMMSQPDEVKRKYIELYEEVPETKTAKNEYGQTVEVPTGRNILKLKSNITRTDLARVYLDKDEKEVEEIRLAEEDAKRRANSKVMLTNPGMTGSVKTPQQSTPKTKASIYNF